MGQCVSVDAKLVDLKDLFRMGQGAALQKLQQNGSPTAGIPFTPGAKHHVKAWMFEARGRAVVDSPVELCDERGFFSLELQRTFSYLILHVRAPGAEGATEEVPTRIAAAVASVLKELASSAGASCSPRGLSIEVASQTEGSLADGLVNGAYGSESGGAAGSTDSGLRYAIFVWHGLSVDPLVKAHVLAKAFELERLLRLGLMRQRGFLDALRIAVPLRGISRPAGQQSPAGNETSRDRGDEGDRARGAADTVRQSGNRLLITLLEGLGLGSTSASRTPRGRNAGLRFPRLGQAVWRSLGATAVPTATNGWLCESRQATPNSPPTAAVAVPMLPSVIAGSAVPVSGRSPPAHLRVPRLPLGCIGPALGQGSIAAPQNGGSSSPSAMEVDGGSPMMQAPWEVPGSRKRCRGESATNGCGATAVSPLAPGVQSARQGPATPSTSAASTPTSRSARSDHSAQLQLPPAIGRLCADAREAVPTKPMSLRPKGVMPTLNFAALGVQRQSSGARPDAPAMLNLDEINMSEEEMQRSWDPNNEENNYHLPHHLCKQWQLRHYRQVCSEVIPGALFISSFQVASELETLQRHKITHIVNTAADVCENRFPQHFSYLTYYLKDTNNEDISLLFYRTLEWIQNAITAGGKVLVHCREGVSRSATMVIAYLMWRGTLSFEVAHERIRKVRPICNPNTGFTFQLLLLGRKLGGPGSTASAAPSPSSGAPDRPQLFRVTPHHPREPFLLLMPVEKPAAWPVFDPRFGWVVQSGTQLLLWIGSQVPDADAVKAAVFQHAKRLEAFEHCKCTLTVTWEGEDCPQLWQALGMPSAPADLIGFAVARPDFDSDFEIMRDTAAATTGGTGVERCRPARCGASTLSTVGCCSHSASPAVASVSL